MKYYNNLKSKFLIFGVDEKIKKSFFKKFGLNSRLAPNVLTVKQKQKLNWFLTKFTTGKKLKERIKNCISFVINNKSYKGTRHKFYYPTRGQRTHTNAKTRKKKIC